MKGTSSSSRDFASLRVRIEALERQNRRLASRIASVLGLLSVSVFLACAVQSERSSVSKASAFQLVDEDGKVRGEWKLTDEGDPSFTLLDDEKRKRYEILLKRDEAVFVRMRDRNDLTRITQIVDETNHPHILLTDVSQKLRLQMAVAGSGAPSLVFFHADGQAPAGIGIHADGRPWLRSDREESR